MGIFRPGSRPGGLVIGFTIGFLVGAAVVEAGDAPERPRGGRGSPRAGLVQPPFAQGPLVRVIRVPDGDTIVLEAPGDETVRLIGIDAPEVARYGGDPECYGEEAGRFARRLLGGAPVRLELDRDPIDPYDRTLAYVYLENGRMANALLVRRGFAVVSIHEPNDRHEDRLHAAEAEARAAGAGLWTAC